MKYTCNICLKSGGDSDFYKRVTSRCKECHKQKMKQVRKDRADYYKDYDAKRFKENPKIRARHRAYQKTPAGKESMEKSRKKWLSENPEKRAAHVILNNRIRSGDVIKPDTCSECGAGGRIDGHHDDYSKPLDVVWLCRTCHVSKHK